jgi:hypothetical protein
VVGLNVRSRLHNSRAESLQGFDFLITHFIRHHEDARIPFDDTGEGESHARVPTGGLDNCATGLEFSFLFGILDNLDGGPVFDTRTGVQVL